MILYLRISYELSIFFQRLYILKEMSVVARKDLEPYEKQYKYEFTL
jgi:hypothetical protein